MKKYFLITFLALGFAAQAQVSIGFKAGLNFSNMDGELEMDAQGNATETIDFSTGFNVGALVNYSITDIFGLRTEFIYAQKGRVINFDGDSYFVFDANPSDPIIATGNRNLSLDVINSYLEIPLLAYAKFGKIEIMGGAYVSTLIGSVADGSLTFTPNSRQGNNFDSKDFTLDYRYRRDEAGEGTGEIIALSVNGRGVDVPNNIGAYYEYSAVDKSLYNLLDLGIIGGLSFYLNDGFFVNARVEYGLTDTTDDSADVSYTQVPINQLNFRNDTDRNFTLHTSVAFRF
ncbi:MAG: porin family protein [Bacteroidota bacterium]